MTYLLHGQSQTIYSIDCRLKIHVEASIYHTGSDATTWAKYTEREQTKTLTCVSAQHNVQTLHNKF